MKRLIYTAWAVLSVACSIAVAKGPTGLGDLKLGMTKDQVEAISPESSVHFTSPLTPYKNKTSKSSGGPDVFTTTIQSPIDPNPLRGALMFTEGKLSSIHIFFEYDSKMLENAKAMITAKYGDPKITDAMTEEQCINRNGTNYKLKSGKVEYSWVDTSPELGYVETTLLEDVMDSCTLTRYAGGAIKSKKMVITRSAPEPPKQENPF
jgi:hypothetical protein